MDSKAIAQAGQAVVVDAHAALIKRCRSDLKAAKEEANDIEARLEMIEHEKEMLEREKQELETRKLRLDAQAEVLARICSEREEESRKELESKWVEVAKGGIQECCYRVLVEAKEPLTAPEIREILENNGVDMGKYDNALAIIHTSLGRIPDRVRSFKHRLGNRGRVYEKCYEATIWRGSGSPRSLP